MERMKRLIKPTEKMKLTINVEYATHESSLAASQWESPSPRLPEQPAWTNMSQLESEAWQKLSSTEKNKALKTCFEELKTAKTAFDQFEKQVVEKNIPRNIPLDKTSNDRINSYLEQVYEKSELLCTKIQEEGSTELEQLEKGANVIRGNIYDIKGGRFISDICVAQRIHQYSEDGKKLIERFEQIKAESSARKSNDIKKEFIKDLDDFNIYNGGVGNYANAGDNMAEEQDYFCNNIWPKIEAINTQTQAWR